MSKLQKKNGRRAIANQAATHESGVSMASWLFFKMDRLVQLLEFRSRGDFLIPERQLCSICAKTEQNAICLR